MRNLHTSRLAAKNAIHQAALLDQVDAAGLVLDRAIAGVWAELLHVLRCNRGFAANLHRAMAIISRLPAILHTGMIHELSGLFYASHRAAAEATLATVPAPILRELAPLPPEAISEAVLIERPQQTVLPGSAEIGMTGVEPVRSKLGKKDEREAFRAMLFPAPPVERVRNILAPLVATGAVIAIGDKERKLPGDLANLLAQGIAAGKTQQQVAKDLLPYFEGARTRAKRSARTFGILVAHEGQMACHEQLGDLVTGYQVHATHDERTRPEHARRDGTIYYKEPESGQKGMDEMPRPPLEGDGSIGWNCRCWMTPVLTPLDALVKSPEKQAVFTQAQGKLVPDPIEYSNWFNRAPERKRTQAVGVRRYYAVADKLQRKPVYADFIDSESGGLLPAKQLQDETASAHAERRQEVDQLLVRRQEQIRQVSTFGFEMPPEPPSLPAPLSKLPKPPPATLAERLAEIYHGAGNEHWRPNGLAKFIEEELRGQTIQQIKDIAREAGLELYGKTKKDLLLNLRYTVEERWRSAMIIADIRRFGVPAS